MTRETTPTVADAEARVADARQRLTRTVGTLQTRLDPRAMARETVDGLTAKGELALRTGMDTARRNPAAVAGAAALLVAVLARKRIARMLTRKKPANTPIAQPYGQPRVRFKPQPVAAKRNDP